MPKSLPEVFISSADIASYVSKEVRKGTLRKLGSRIYTTNLKESPETLIKRHVWFLVGSFFPGAVIVDRTAMEHRPAKDGSVFIVSKKKRSIVLPGLRIYPRKGQGPLSDDKPFMDNLYLSSLPRTYLENLCQRRTRKGKISRALSREEIEEKLETLLQTIGEEALQKLRKDAKKISSQLKMNKEWKVLDHLIGALLGTREAKEIQSPLYLARLQGYPY